MTNCSEYYNGIFNAIEFDRGDAIDFCASHSLHVYIFNLTNHNEVEA